MRELRVRRCTAEELDAIYAVINEAAEAYRGVIPADCWKEPYMPRAELQEEIGSGVEFWGCGEEGDLLGVMGLQRVDGVCLVRHAYVRRDYQGRGIGGALLDTIREEARDEPLLVGTWAAAQWAIRFYESRGFAQVGVSEKNELLRRYWQVPERQMEESVVLVEEAEVTLP